MSLLQIVYYSILRGRKKSPLHVMNSHKIYEICKGQHFNQLGLCESYNPLLDLHILRSHYVVLACSNLLSKFEPDLNPVRFAWISLDSLLFPNKPTFALPEMYTR